MTNVPGGVATTRSEALIRNVASTVVTPKPATVARPVGDTVTTDGSEDSQVASDVTSRVDWSTRVAVALNWTVSPTADNTEGPMMLRPLSGGEAESPGPDVCRPTDSPQPSLATVATATRRPVANRRLRLALRFIAVFD
jgi:hypothetical protein